MDDDGYYVPPDFLNRRDDYGGVYEPLPTQLFLDHQYGEENDFQDIQERRQFEEENDFQENQEQQQFGEENDFQNNQQQRYGEEEQHHDDFQDNQENDLDVVEEDDMIDQLGEEDSIDLPEQQQSQELIFIEEPNNQRRSVYELIPVEDNIQQQSHYSAVPSRRQSTSSVNYNPYEIPPILNSGPEVLPSYGSVIYQDQVEAIRSRAPSPSPFASVSSFSALPVQPPINPYSPQAAFDAIYAPPSEVARPQSFVNENPHSRNRLSVYDHEELEPLRVENGSNRLSRGNQIQLENLRASVSSENQVRKWQNYWEQEDDFSYLTHRPAPMFSVFFVPTFIFLAIPLIAFYIPLMASLIGTPVAVVGLNRLFAVGFDPFNNLRFPTAKPLSPCGDTFLVASFLATSPFTLPFTSFILFFYYPLLVLVFLPISAFLGLLSCICTCTRPSFGEPIKQSIDFTLRLILWTLVPIWNVAHSVDNEQEELLIAAAMGRMDAAILRREDFPPTPSPSASLPKTIVKPPSFFRVVDVKKDRRAKEINKAERNLRLFTGFLWLLGIQIALPIFDSVTDILFFFQIYDRFLEPLPDSEQTFFTIMTGLSGLATLVNLVIHGIWVLRLLWQLLCAMCGKYRISSVIWAHASFIAPPAAAKVDSVKLLAPPVSFEILRFLKLICGDALHVVVSCLTLGFFGQVSPSLVWYLTNATSIVSCAWLLAVLTLNSLYIRVIRKLLGRSIMRFFMLLFFSCILASPVILVAIGAGITTSSVCNIPWTKSTTDDVVLNSVASSCANINFDLYISDATELTTLTFSQAVSAQNIFIANTNMQSISFPVLRSAYSIQVTENNYLTSFSFPVLESWSCIESMGGCANASGIVVTDNPRLTTLQWTQNLPFPHNGNTGMTFIRIMGNQALQTLSIQLNQTCFLVQISDNPSLISLQFSVPFAYITILNNNPSLSALNLSMPVSCFYAINPNDWNYDRIGTSEDFSTFEINDRPETYSLLSTLMTEISPVLVQPLASTSAFSPIFQIASNSTPTILNLENLFNYLQCASGSGDAITMVLNFNVQNNHNLQQLTLPVFTLASSNALMMNGVVNVTGNPNLVNINIVEGYYSQVYLATNNNSVISALLTNGQPSSFCTPLLGTGPITTACSPQSYDLVTTLFSSSSCATSVQYIYGC